MTQISVRALGAADWQTYREVRLAALRDAPDAFVSTLTQEEALPQQEWQDRMTRSMRLVAQNGTETVGVASVGDAEEPATAQVFGLWVSPESRGSGIAGRLVQAAATAARQQGKTQLTYWVGTDNPRAVAFASAFGFRPGDARRPMHEGGDDEEILMVLALGDNRGEPTLTRTF